MVFPFDKTKFVQPQNTLKFGMKKKNDIKFRFYGNLNILKIKCKFKHY